MTSDLTSELTLDELYAMQSHVFISEDKISAVIDQLIAAMRREAKLINAMKDAYNANSLDDNMKILHRAIRSEYQDNK